MHFWTLSGQLQSPLLTMLCLGVLLLAARSLARLLPGLRRLAIPDALLAGVLGLLLGPSALDALALDSGTLKRVVYHGGALIFLILALRSPDQSKPQAAVKSYAFAIPLIASMQALLGLAVATALHHHIGFGLMLPLGFSQGPGVALSMGDAWEATSGMPDGGQIGLMISGLGFFVCCIVGVAMFHVARHRGWLQQQPSEDEAAATLSAEPEPEAGDIDPMTFHVGLIGSIYLLTFGILYGLSQQLGNRPKLVAQLWGFHFLVVLGLAIAGRKLLTKTKVGDGVSNLKLNRLAGLVVDFTTCAAIAAVRLDLVARYWLVLVLMALTGSLATAAVCLWLARRAFFSHPFEAILVMFGALTGTLPTGLTLLRLADPKMKSPVARNYVLGSGASVLPSLALLGLLPVVVAQPQQLPLWAGLLTGYCLVLVAAWRRFGGLRFRRPLGQIWPKELTPSENADQADTSGNPA